MARSAMLLALLLLLTAKHHANALTLSMVASSPRFHRNNNIRVAPPPSVTSTLISSLAVVALKLRLKHQSGVKCDVTATSSDLLLKGKVGPVTVKGRRWQSQLGLTCRAIEATVETCDLDMGRIVSHQKLVLNTPARGNAMVALNSVDFGNFITHPLMKPPGLMNGEGIQFLSDNISIDAKTGVICFLGVYRGETFSCRLKRGLDQAEVTATSSQKETCSKLSTTVSEFFNEMVFELDGTFLSFRDMMVTAKGGEPSVMFALHITVKKFPSPGLEF